MSKIPRRIKTRIRQLIARELRERLSEIPGYLDFSTDEALINAWSDYVCEIANQISPRPQP